MSTHTPAFLISALIHLGLLTLVLTGVAQLPSDSAAETRLAVRLEMFQPPPPPPEPEAEPEPEPIQEPEPVVELEPEPEPEPEVVEPPPPPPKPKPVPKPKPMPEPKPRPKPPPVEQPIEPLKQTPLPVAPAVDMGLIRRLEEEYKAALRKAIENNKGYPRRAVRLRQEGEVLVGFTVRRDGVIGALRIVESSGSKLLDTAARRAVEKISGRLPFPEEFKRDQWEFTIPINYGLR
ncbi:MAG: energy transducer TonB [Candidatus Thiodiazotropha endolucinida]|nr:energy transducer TonB [Candidatus Thiodiazotropha endolucinida]